MLSVNILYGNGLRRLCECEITFYVRETAEDKNKHKLCWTLSRVHNFLNNLSQTQFFSVKNYRPLGL